MDGLLGVPRLIDEPLCLAPGPPSHPRDPARITPLPLVPFHLGIGLARRVSTAAVGHVRVHVWCETRPGPSSWPAWKQSRQPRPARIGQHLPASPLAQAPGPPSAMTCSRHGQWVITSYQLSPRRSGPRWPAIHAMLYGSIAIKTGARCKKISSRQSTRTRA